MDSNFTYEEATIFGKALLPEDQPFQNSFIVVQEESVVTKLLFRYVLGNIFKVFSKLPRNYGIFYSSGTIAFVGYKQKRLIYGYEPEFSFTRSFSEITVKKKIGLYRLTATNMNGKKVVLNATAAGAQKTATINFVDMILSQS